MYHYKTVHECMWPLRWEHIYFVNSVRLVVFLTRLLAAPKRRPPIWRRPPPRGEKQQCFMAAFVSRQRPRRQRPTFKKTLGHGRPDRGWVQTARTTRSRLPTPWPIRKRLLRRRWSRWPMARVSKAVHISRVGHRVLFRSERNVLLRSFKECNILLRSFFEFLATYETQKNNAFFCVLFLRK